MKKPDLIFFEQNIISFDFGVKYDGFHEMHTFIT